MYHLNLISARQLLFPNLYSYIMSRDSLGEEFLIIPAASLLRRWILAALYVFNLHSNVFITESEE